MKKIPFIFNRGIMKKLSIVLLLVLTISFSACGHQNSNNQEEEESGFPSNSIEDTGTKIPENENLTKWQMAGKGVGKILPEPQKEYSLPQSSSFIVAEVDNSTYEFFESYVNQCIKAGFNGTIGTASSPDYYFNGETVNGERVQVMYYQDDAKCSISAFPAE